ncbi:uncharacterized protein LOC106062349 isoform X2 [Biomphalaria glabrata]|uniref:Uncharacterized protein LOC106062349 isoform X2 n=1 Tax=Biomphalaria glabrata TaxID=6526 RepID=A0A9W2Z6E7_BIOGL|nr:uncharacterized protein LOC106062349 isoform X2 [Biomphalaria glabrata]
MTDRDKLMMRMQNIRKRTKQKSVQFWSSDIQLTSSLYFVHYDDGFIFCGKAGFYNCNNGGIFTFVYTGLHSTESDSSQRNVLLPTSKMCVCPNMGESGTRHTCRCVRYSWMEF